MGIHPSLPTVKDVLLEFAPRISSLVPEVEPKRPVSSMVKFLFQMMREAANLSPDLHKPEGRWPELMSASERVLLFVSEEDGHYAGQLAQAMLLTHDLVGKSRERFPPGAKGDVAWMQWAAEHGITRVKEKSG